MTRCAELTGKPEPRGPGFRSETAFTMLMVCRGLLRERTRQWRVQGARNGWAGEGNGTVGEVGESLAGFLLDGPYDSARLKLALGPRQGILCNFLPSLLGDDQVRPTREFLEIRDRLRLAVLAEGGAVD